MSDDGSIWFLFAVMPLIFLALGGSFSTGYSTGGSLPHPRIQTRKYPFFSVARWQCCEKDCHRVVSQLSGDWRCGRCYKRLGSIRW